MGCGFIGLIQAQYCLPLYLIACTSGDYIDGVQFNTISNLGTGCANPGANYSNYTSMSTNVMPSSSYTITLTPTPSWSQGFAVWIDYNQNLSFGDPGEMVFQSTVTGTTPQTGTVNIPGFAFPGPTRMRVMCFFAGIPQPTDYCTQNATFGETEDYTVVIGTPSADDLGVTAITGPASGCGLSATTQITADIANFGTNTQTNPTVSFNVDGGAITTETTSYVIPSGSTFPYIFTGTANLSVPGWHTIKAWTNLPNDGFTPNDTTTLLVQNIPTVSVFPYQENFDQNDGGWAAFGTNSTWQWGAPAGPTINTPYSSPNVWTTNLTGVYLNNDQSYVLSPCFNFSSLNAPVIEMAIWWNAENSWDGAVLQSSTNNGATWQNVGAYLDPVNWYNFQNLITSPGSPYNPNNEAWNGTSGPGWVIAKHDLTGLQNQSAVRLRVAFSSDGSVQYDGFAFDNVLIYDKPAYDVGVAGLGAATPTSLCSGPNTPIELVLGNFGSQAQSNIQVVAQITGPVNTTLNGTYVPSLPVGGVANYTIGTLNTTVPGLYYITAYTSNIADGLHLNDTSYFVIDVAPSPIDPTVNNPVSCFPDSLILTATGNPPGVDYFWYDAIGGNLLTVNDSFQTPFLTTTTTYYVVGKSKVSFDVGPLNNGFGPGFNTSFTSGNGLIFNVMNPDGITIDSVLVYPTSAGLMSVIVSNSSGQIVSSINAVVPNPVSPGAPTKVALGIDVPFGTNYTIAGGPSVPGALFYNYGGAVYPYTDAGNNVSIVNTTNNFGNFGYYYYFYDWDISAYACESNPVPANALIGVSPPVNLGPDAIVCGSYTIDATTAGGITYSWSSGQTVPDIIITNNGIYGIAVTDINGCIGTDSINVNILPSPTVDLGPDINGCTQSAILDAGAQTLGSTYLWSANANYANTQTVSVTTAGTYSVTVVNPAGCIATDTIVVALNGVDVDLGPDIVSCGAPVILNAGNLGAAYSWSTGSLTQSITVTAPGGSYSVIASMNGCFDVDVINVSFGSAPIVDLGPDITACDIATLDAGTGGSIYNWSNGANTQMINVTQTGTYNVTVSIGNGCGTTDQINVTIYQSPLANFTYTNPQPAVYNFSSLTTTGSLPLTYSWNFGDGTTSNLQQPTHTYAAAGSYQVTLVVTHATCGSSTYQQEINSFTAIEDGLLNGDVAIYPNPNNGIFTVSSDNLQADAFSISITDVQGKNVYYNVIENVNGFSQEINLTALAKGVYIVKLSDGNRSGFTRVVIE